MTDNGQFTEEQRAEACRQERVEHLHRQTSALESIRNYVGWLLAIVVVGITLSFVFIVGSAGIRF